MQNCQRVGEDGKGLQPDDIVVIRVGELTIENKIQI
jgi:hypothetical protein